VTRLGTLVLTIVLTLLAAAPNAQTLKQQNAKLLGQMKRVYGLNPDQMKRISGILARSGIAGQGNPAVTRHPMSVDTCKTNTAGKKFDNARFRKICGKRFMAPLYDPATERPEDAKACIDQFEFPNIPCTYPVVWTKASEAADLCQAVGKRLCDAHEWEGACQGSLQPPDYRFDLAKGFDASTAVARMRAASNAKNAGSKRWSYGPSYKAGICGAASTKTAGCGGGEFNNCGSNTYPTGAFPKCVSKLGVYDLNGNAAEHMNLPLAPDQMASTGSKKLGVTEMKGSWFIFDKFRAHPDWCRWRAPFWHGAKVRSPASHANYHLGFRCCSSLN